MMRTRYLKKWNWFLIPFMRFVRRLNRIGTQKKYSRESKDTGNLSSFVLHTNTIAVAFIPMIIILLYFTQLISNDSFKTFLVSLVALIIIIGQSFKWVGKFNLSSHSIYLFSSILMVVLEYYTFSKEKTQGGYFLYLFVLMIISLFINSNLLKRGLLNSILYISYPIIGLILCLAVFPWQFEDSAQILLNFKNTFFLNLIFFILLLFILMLSQLKISKELKKQLIKNSELLIEAHEDSHKAVIRSAISSQESERNRISRDIHDGVGQLLTVARINVQSINLCDIDEKIYDQLNNIASILTNAVEELRNISYNLQPIDIDSENLCDLLIELCSQSTIPDKTRVTFYADNYVNYEDLLPDQKLHLFRIAQEAINNSLKHAKASAIKVGLEFKDTVLTLKISDNGNGFEFNNTNLGNGLKNIKLRSKLLQAGSEIKSSSTQGTSIQISLKVLPKYNLKRSENKFTVKALTLNG